MQDHQQFDGSDLKTKKKKTTHKDIVGDIPTSAIYWCLFNMPVKVMNKLKIEPMQNIAKKKKPTYTLIYNIYINV